MSQTTKPRSRISQSRVWVYFKQCDGDPDKARCNLCSVVVCHRGTTNVLWNHVKIKHSINRTSLSQDNQDINFESSIMIPAKQQQRRSKSNTNHIASNNQLPHQNQSDLILDYNDLSLASMKPLPSTSLSKNLISRLNQLSSPVTRKLKFWNKKSFQVNQYDPNFKVIYLGNLGVQLWSKDESCLDKPLSTLWNNYLVNMKTEIVMRLTICNSGLKAITRQHGLTQYWSNRLVYCCSHKNYPRIFSWVYRHEGKKMRQELRCHAVFCPSPEKASKMVTLLNERISCALQEFRREKKSRCSPTMMVTQNESPFHQNLQRTVPLRRQILAKGSANFRPPLERSKSAPKLTSIVEEEDYESSEGEMVEQLHDVFEYEELFGSKDDDDDEEKEDNNSDCSAKEDDEGSTNKIESSNSSTETNSKSKLAQTKHFNNLTGTRPNCDQPSNFSSELHGNQNEIHTNHHQKNYNHNDHNPSHKNHNNTSANTNISSSSNNRLVINQFNSLRQETIMDNDKLLLVNQNRQAKLDNSSASSNRLEPLLADQRQQEQQQIDDTPTKEIILSWSNLVIK